MGAGFVQVSINNDGHLYLSTNPQITYFKIIYKKHTHFAIEHVMQHFTGSIDFGKQLTANIQKIGDLMHKVYLEIDLPVVCPIKCDPVSLNHQNTIEILYQYVTNYLQFNLMLVRKIITGTSIEHLTNNYKSVLLHYIQTHHSLVTNIYQKNLNIILQDIELLDVKTDIDNHKLSFKLPFLKNHFYHFCLQLYKPVSDAFAKEKAAIQNNCYKFAWAKELGHSLIDYVNFRIGSNVIDTHTGDWLSIRHHLFSQVNDSCYQQMIGNVDHLTVFNDLPKNSYKLIIPLHFWFCEQSGLALPLLPLRSSEVSFNVQLRNLKEVCQIDECFPNDMDAFQTKYNVYLQNAQLCVDYIYLDKEEKLKFAQNNHQYLIETVQSNYFNQNVTNKVDFHLYFSQPTKWMVWFMQSLKNRQSYQRYQYEEIATQISINNNVCGSFNLDAIYYDSYQPYLYFEASLPKGLNVYSFALQPKMYQPSGTLNLSVVDDLKLTLALNNKQVLETYFAVYTVSYNILQIKNGLASVLF